MKSMSVVIIKPSKYDLDGFVERYCKGFMPNSTVPYFQSMIPAVHRGVALRVAAVDEYVHTSLDYLSLLRSQAGERTLVLIVGVQSHQFHRALDLAALAEKGGCMVCIGGPHVMTCDTASVQGRGISFALAEAESILLDLLDDAISGELRPVYGDGERWAAELDPPSVQAPSRRDMKRYIIPMLGVYPARGCPFSCNFCSVIKIAGRRIRSQPVSTTLQTLRAAKAAGIRMIMFTSDNFNKYPQVAELMHEMIREKLEMRFFAQCDTQVGKQDELVALMARAGCRQIFVGAESFDRQTLLAANKPQNRPERYEEIVNLCRKNRILSHFSNIIGFPGQTQAAIDEHVAILKELSPAHASFYVLCPIPGTEQYADFLERGLIDEPNLDRFDTTCLTWRHPNLSRSEIRQALFDCYRRFYTLKHSLAQIPYLPRDDGPAREAAEMIGAVVYNRIWAAKQIHPMSGGVGRLRIDNARDLGDLRMRTFGFALAPLPRNLDLNEQDETGNRSSSAAARALDVRRKLEIQGLAGDYMSTAPRPLLATQ
ncbi:MAG: radical SAM protein [Capsulimonadaceae bacterium]|nr:radical SAM protein [Capsulimonadaceae bacterium]